MLSLKIAMFFCDDTHSDATKFKDAFEMYKVCCDGTETPDDNKLTEEMDKLKVVDNQQQDADSSNQNTSGSTPVGGGEGVKAENSKAAADDDDKEAKDSKKDEPQESASAE